MLRLARSASRLGTCAYQRRIITECCAPSVVCYGAPPMPLRSAAPALIGKVLGGRFRVVQLIGSGGLGDVYLAEAAVPGASASSDPRGRVAIKVLRAEHRADPDLVDRFQREAEAAARVRHENVIAVLEAPVERDGVLYFVAELLVGLDLADTLAYSGTLGPARALKIASGVAEGLAAAHAASVIHRDVKPENVFLVHAADGREAVKLLDFGLAFLPGDEVIASPARVVGTPEYMAPEQAQGAPASPRADVYSLGVVLFEMITGRVPFSGTYATVARLHAEASVPPLRAATRARQPPPSAELEAAVTRALAKDPAARFASMHDFIRALSAAPEAADLRRG
ncbi:Serine/threonine protein kinase PrkC, regulator of stationary phase [Minicystis rosea]|nr:Serine/threonine protein kinase PrkC, regulator of stationary phase [Minicystis rosea]